jgi:hypothetical protein
MLREARGRWDLISTGHLATVPVARVENGGSLPEPTDSARPAPRGTLAPQPGQPEHLILRSPVPSPISAPPPNTSSVHEKKEEGEPPMSMVDLPTREDLKRAISPWWSGGGTAEILIDVLRNQEATLSEGERLATKMAERADRGQSYVSREVVEEQLELIRAASAYRANKVALSQEQSSRNAHPEIGSAEWLRRAEEIARKNEAHYAQFGGYSEAIGKWKELHASGERLR